MKKKKLKPSRKKSVLVGEVIEVMSENPSRAMNYKQVAGKLSITDKGSRRVIFDIMSELVESGKATENSRGKFKIKSKRIVVQGTVDMTRKGSGFVKSSELKEDVFVAERNIGRALHGDTVEVLVSPGKRRAGKGPDGRISKVIERARTEFVGTLQIKSHSAFLIADSPKMTVDIYIPQNKLNSGKDGQKVLVTITDWPEDANSPFGEVTEVLGNPGEIPVEINSILAEYGFPLKFPKAVENEAASIPIEISKKEIGKRKDFRNITTFTIDPADAKDFDDALSVRRLENGHLEIGVHIADVSHYVQPGSLLEAEAKQRATSVYLVDRVIPMLPEVLSNNLCSLRPKEDKLTFSVVFTMDEEGNVLSKWIGRTVIHSDHRFTYEEVQEIIENGKGKYLKEIEQLNGIAKTLRQARISNGALSFEKTEVRFKLDENGAPADIYFKVQKEAHKLIEEFMLLANKAVAEFFGKRTKDQAQTKTGVYRVHDTPDPGKLADFVEFIGKFGYKMTAKNSDKIAIAMNKLLSEVRGTGEQDVIETLAIRTMAKAVYTTENIGHYGLGFRHYTHFTSPIRRYPDVMVHRLIDRYQNGGTSADAERMEERCKKSSEMERKAEKAERESTKYFQVLYMKDALGQQFEGIISGINDWGIFVELVENKCEGMIRMRNLDGDFYYFDEKNYQAVGQNTGKELRLGDKIKIEVSEIDLPNKRLDFRLV